MIRKSVSSAVLAMLAAAAVSPVFALTNTGFEDGNANGWTTPVGSMNVYGAAGTTVQLIDDGYGLYAPIPVALTPIDGSHFGLLSLPCSDPSNVSTCTSGFSFTANLGGPTSRVGDIMWVRFMTPDFRGNGAPADYNDNFSVSYFGTNSTTALATDTLSVDSMWTEDLNEDGIADNTAYDSGWRGFAVPENTNSITLTLQNGPAGDMYNRPYVALDYYAAPAAAVPEADTVAMMLAGLGVLGAVSRRRAVRKAK